MLHSLPAFTKLIDHAEAEVEQLDDVNGWCVDRWLMSDAAINSLCELYEVLITGNVDEAIEDALADAGVDVEALFFDEADNETRHRTTRADMCELAAAAAWVAIDAWPTETLHMPNVPKGSRNRSESGIDVMAVALVESQATEPEDGECLYVGSVKHTVTSVQDLRSKLVHSVGAGELTSVYLVQQLRLFVGRLEERGIQAQRAFLFAAQTPTDSGSISIALSGAADSADAEAFLEELDALPNVDELQRDCRLLLVGGLATLHGKVAL